MSTPSTTVTMLSPTGVPGEIPVERADEAAKAGFVRGVNMTSPSGKSGVIPLERATEAQKAGFKQQARPATDTTVQPVNKWQGIAAGKGFVPTAGTQTVATPSASARGGWGGGHVGPQEIKPMETQEAATKDARDAAITAATSMIPWEKAAAPAARFAAENILPVANKIPYVGAALKAAEEAPTLLKAAARGATGGAITGATEEGIRTRSPIGAAKGALVGGGVGALAGGAGYGITKMGAPAVEAAAPTMAAEPSVVSKEPFELTSPNMGRETAIQPPLPMGQPQTIGPLESPQPKASMSKFGDLIEHEGAGAPRLDPNVPIGQQRFGGPTTFRRPALAENPDVQGGVITAPEKMPTMPPEQVGNQMGAPPLKPDVPLRGQFKPMEPAAETPPSRQASLEAKYPDKAVRQLVHANGEEIVDAAAGDQETIKAIHDLKNPDVRQAMINSGEDMGQVAINNRKASGDMSRQEAFAKMLKKGLSPKDILRLAKQPIEVADAIK
jgi:hypothetical protein